MPRFATLRGQWRSVTDTARKDTFFNFYKYLGRGTFSDGQLSRIADGSLFHPYED